MLRESHGSIVANVCTYPNNLSMYAGFVLDAAHAERQDGAISQLQVFITN